MIYLKASRDGRRRELSKCKWSGNFSKREWGVMLEKKLKWLTGVNSPMNILKCPLNNLWTVLLNALTRGMAKYTILKKKNTGPAFLFKMDSSRQSEARWENYSQERGCKTAPQKMYRDVTYEVKWICHFGMNLFPLHQTLIQPSTLL